MKITEKVQLCRLTRLKSEIEIAKRRTVIHRRILPIFGKGVGGKLESSQGNERIEERGRCGSLMLIQKQKNKLVKRLVSGDGMRGEMITNGIMENVEDHSDDDIIIFRVLECVLTLLQHGSTREKREIASCGIGVRRSSLEQRSQQHAPIDDGKSR